MLVKTIDINKTPVNLQDLLSIISQNTEVMITQDDIPLARLSPVSENHSTQTLSQEKERIPNLHPGSMIMSDDFDDPLPDEFWLGEDA